VSKLKRQTRELRVLADLNTKPRTTYLAKMWLFYEGIGIWGN
jgi:hypothetical protein